MQEFHSDLEPDGSVANGLLIPLATADARGEPEVGALEKWEWVESRADESRK